MENLSQYRWLVFTSPAGPEIFFRRLRQQHKDARALAGLKIAVAAAEPHFAHAPDALLPLFENRLERVGAESKKTILCV